MEPSRPSGYSIASEMRSPRLIRALALGAAACLAVPVCAQEIVGQIEGDNVAVRGQVTMVREAGRKKAAVASGSEVTVKSGGARLVLADGSELDICGPAQFSVLKAGEAITVAVNYGRVHARLSAHVPVTLYTPLIVATPLGISGRPRDLVLGVEASGAVCARPSHGAVRLEQQLDGASLVVPQGGEVSLPDGQTSSLHDAAETCRCDPVLSEDREPEKARPVQVSTAALPKPGEKKEEPKIQEPPVPAKEVPQWTVVMPPLTFDANAPAAPAPSPEQVVLYREARAVTAVVLTGHVEEKKAEPAPPAPVMQAAATQALVKPTFFGRIGGFFRRLFGGKPKS